jgi:hypothetical protein
MALVTGRFPNDGLRYPKIDEKPPFMTREEIERRIAGPPFGDRFGPDRRLAVMPDVLDDADAGRQFD